MAIRSTATRRWAEKEVEMRKTLKTTLAVALCGASALSAAPSEVLAGTMSVASPTLVRPTAPVENVYYRRYYRHHRYYRHRRYYRYYGYGYDPSGAIFAGAALGLIGAGIAASQPHYYYGPYWGGYPGYYGWGW
jgi:hypothetical protein